MKKADITEVEIKNINGVIYYEITIDIVSVNFTYFFNPYKRLLKVMGFRVFLFLLFLEKNTKSLNFLDNITLTPTDRETILK